MKRFLTLPTCLLAIGLCTTLALTGCNVSVKPNSTATTPSGATDPTNDTTATSVAETSHATTSQSASDTHPSSMSSSDKLALLKAYDQAVATFDLVTMDKANDKLASNETFYVYIGAKTCKYCVALAPVLAKVAKDHHLTVLYVNSDANDPALETFAKAHKLEYIPALFVAKDGEFQKIDVSDPYTEQSVTKALDLKP